MRPVKAGVYSGNRKPAAINGNPGDTSGVLERPDTGEANRNVYRIVSH